MPLTLTIRTNPNTGIPLIQKFPKGFKVHFLVTPSGAYVTSGDAFDLTSLTVGPGFVPPISALPEYVVFRSMRPASSAQTNLFVYNYVPGTALTNGKFQVFTGAAAQTALTELSAGAYPAGVLADVIEAEAFFPS